VNDTEIMGQTEEDRHDGIDRTGQAEWDRQVVTDRIY
jgi:hypothetical protein